MRHVWLILALLFFALGTVQLRSIKRGSSRQAVERPTEGIKTQQTPTTTVPPNPDRFSEVISQRHTFSIKEIEEDKWAVTVPKGGWYDTGIPITANMSLVVYADEPFQAKVADQVFSGDKVTINRSYALAIGFYEIYTTHTHPFPGPQDRLPGVTPDFLSTLELQQEGNELEFIIKAHHKVYAPEDQLLKNDPAHSEMHRAADERAARLRRRIAKQR